VHWAVEVSGRGLLYCLVGLMLLYGKLCVCEWNCSCSVLYTTLFVWQSHIFSLLLSLLFRLVAQNEGLTVSKYLFQGPDDPYPTELSLTVNATVAPTAANTNSNTAAPTENNSPRKYVHIYVYICVCDVISWTSIMMVVIIMLSISLWSFYF
jgi:hypothetical protein